MLLPLLLSSIFELLPPKNLRIFCNSAGFVTVSDSPATSKVGVRTPAQVVSPGIPPTGVPSTPSYVGRVPQAMRLHTGVLLCLLYRTWSPLVSGSASAPTRRLTLVLFRPPRRSQYRQRSKIGPGMWRRRRKDVTSLGDGGDARGQTAISPRICFFKLGPAGEVVDANIAEREQPKLWAIKTTPWPASLSRCPSIAVASSSASASTLYASQESGSNLDNPQPGRSIPKHGPTLDKLVSRWLNWASDPPKPCTKTSNGIGDGFIGSLSFCGCGL